MTAGSTSFSPSRSSMFFGAQPESGFGGLLVMVLAIYMYRRNLRRHSA